MELYTKESLKEVIEKSKDEFYMPKALFDHYKSLRLETKLAYVSILETMKNKAGYTTENTAYIKVDNPQIQVNLAKLANKEVDQEKVNKYLKAGIKAVRECTPQALVALHLETPNVWKYKTIMNTWKRDNVDYDVLGSSY